MEVHQVDKFQRKVENISVGETAKAKSKNMNQIHPPPFLAPLHDCPPLDNSEVITELH